MYSRGPETPRPLQRPHIQLTRRAIGNCLHWPPCCLHWCMSALESGFERLPWPGQTIQSLQTSLQVPNKWLWQLSTSHWPWQAHIYWRSGLAGSIPRDLTGTPTLPSWQAEWVQQSFASQCYQVHRLGDSHDSELEQISIYSSAGICLLAYLM